MVGSSRPSDFCVGLGLSIRLPVFPRLSAWYLGRRVARPGTARDSLPRALVALLAMIQALASRCFAIVPTALSAVTFATTAVAVRRARRDAP